MKERLFEAEGMQSPETLPAPPLSNPKPAVAKKTKSAVGKKRKSKSSKRSAKKAAAKRKPAPKRVKPSRRVASNNPDGRPSEYPDKTMLRMPKGWLKTLNAKAAAKGMSQAEFTRSVMKRALGK